MRSKPRIRFSRTTCYPIGLNVKFTYWQEDGWFLGYLNDFPETWTQGQDLEDLKAHLLDLHEEFSTGGLQPERDYRVGELEVA